MVHNGPSMIAKDPLLPKTAPLLPLQSLGRSDFSQKLESSLSPVRNCTASVFKIFFAEDAKGGGENRTEEACLTVRLLLIVLSIAAIQP
ncbi:hypothetical protein DPMN_069762 [Dreissena polymorpha]|uniref:Uncharacterized protein n=1 Tax=Dreissena polymorpha TaxID=45954 RepID=A0A9D3Z1R7_DREPO|nr:hypothetical protein DPMN_069762 [Dreissena polymorpha]